MRSHRHLPVLLTAALGIALMTLGSSAARASGIRTDVVDTAVVGGTEADFPLAVVLNFEGGSSLIHLTRDGEFHWAVDPKLGNFTGITINDTRVPIETGGSVPIPGTDRRITVSFATTTDADGKVHTRVTMVVG